MVDRLISSKCQEGLDKTIHYAPSIHLDGRRLEHNVGAGETRKNHYGYQNSQLKKKELATLIWSIKSLQEDLILYWMSL